MKVPVLLVPLVVVLAVGSGVVLGQRLPAPTYVQDYAATERPRDLTRADLIVDNLLCRGRSALLGRFLEQDAGIVRLETYVAEMRARILYDPQRTDLASIRKRIETQVQIPASAQSGARQPESGRGATPALQTVQPFRVIEVREGS